MLTAAAVAKELGVSRRMVYELARRRSRVAQVGGQNVPHRYASTTARAAAPTSVNAALIAFLRLA